jgi:hypothetical protein
MRVTKKSAERDDLIGLKVLAMVLNFDFEAGSPRDLERLKRLSPYDFANVEWVLTKGDPDDKKRANGIREELRADLEPIIPPEKEVSVTEAYGRIHRLLEKINKIESKTIWGVEPVDYKWVESDENGEFIPKEADDARDTTWYWASGRTVELLGYKWFVGVQGVAGAFAFSRDELYLKIREAFQIGVFDRLRICPHCKKFFVAEDARQRFCSDEHRNEFNNKQRLESGWFKKRRRDNRQRQIAKARRLLREGKSPAQIAKETKLPLRVLKREGLIH